MSNEAINWAVGFDITRNAARKLILLLLANRANDEWECWPSVGLLAQEAGISIGQVRKHLAALEAEDKAIRRLPWERKDGGQGANGYLLGPSAAAEDTPHAFSSRGGGRIRAGGFSNTSGGGDRKRDPLNPKENTTGKPEGSAAREETRRRSSARAPERPMSVTEAQLFAAVDALAADPAEEKFDQYAEMVGARAPRLWQRSRSAAAAQYAEAQGDQEPTAFDIHRLACKYVIRARTEDWPAWLSGPLIPYIPPAQPMENAA